MSASKAWMAGTSPAMTLSSAASIAWSSIPMLNAPLEIAVRGEF